MKLTSQLENTSEKDAEPRGLEALTLTLYEGLEKVQSLKAELTAWSSVHKFKRNNQSRLIE